MTIGSARIPYRVFLKFVGRYSPRERMIRIARIVWRRGKGPGTGEGYCASLSLALRPSLVSFAKEQGRSIWDEWRVTLFGVQVHFNRSYGGWICSLLACAVLLALGGCQKPYIDGSEKAPSFPVVTPLEDESPDDREQFPPEPAKPAVPAQLPAGYECRDGQCGPSRSFQEQPVRRVFSRLPIVRRFGR